MKGINRLIIEKYIHKLFLMMNHVILILHTVMFVKFTCRKLEELEKLKRYNKLEVIESFGESN